MSDNKLKILFLCTGASCRSQMAKGWANHLFGDKMEAFAAGTNPHGIDKLAVKAMADAGVDISDHKSQHVDELADIEFDIVITVCDNAKESCPIFHGVGKVMHHGFEDPPKLAENATTDEEAMAHYARVRDEIKEYVVGLMEEF